MNVWIRRGVGALVLSTGLVAAGASTAQAAAPAGSIPFIPITTTDQTALTFQSVDQSATQNGFVNVNAPTSVQLAGTTQNNTTSNPFLNFLSGNF